MTPIVDPDLEAALGDLVWTARRIRQLNSLLLIHDQSDIVNGYQKLSVMLQERADKWGEIRARSDKLHVPPPSADAHG